MSDPNEEPDHSCADRCCPDCERLNQFGELCPQCREEAQNILAEKDREAELEEQIGNVTECPRPSEPDPRRGADTRES